MARYNLEIKEASSSLAKLVFVKIPDNADIEEISCDAIKYESNNVNNTVAIPKTVFKYRFVGYSHNLKESVILEHFRSQKEFYALLSYHDILYNYSAWTGKWAVLVVDVLN